MKESRQILKTPYHHVAISNRRPVGEDTAALAQNPPEQEGWAPPGKRPSLFRGNPLDSLDWLPLERVAGAVRESYYLLAETQDLGERWDPACPLAGFPLSIG